MSFGFLGIQFGRGLQMANMSPPHPEDPTLEVRHLEVRACAATFPIVFYNQKAEVKAQQSTGINLSYVFRGELRRGTHTGPKT